MTAVLAARGLGVSYGGRRVLALEEFSLERGERLVLMGPNGSGKSTLLRVLALLERPATGSLEVLGAPAGRGARGLLALRRRMATVFQAPLLSDGTVYDNVALGLRFRGGFAAEQDRLVRYWLERFGIAPLAARLARTLSGGEAQRTSLARAFVLEPEVLFLDEPFAALDVQGRETLALELEAILHEASIATILVTHDRAEALMLADRVAIMLDGALAQTGEVRTVFTHPATEPIARFVGVENLLPALVLESGADWGVVELAGQRLRVRLPRPGVSRVLLCLRADDVHLAPAGESAEPGMVSLAARVERVVPFGVPYRLHLDAGVALTALAARRTVERLRPIPGAPLVASFDPQALHAIPL